MATIRIARHLAAPTDLVFDLAVNPVRLQECMPEIEEIWDVQGAQDHVGDSFRFKDREFGRLFEGESQVVEAVRPTLQTTLSTYRNGMKVRWTMRFSPAGDGTDAVDEVEYEVPAGALGAIGDRLLLHPLMERRLRQATRRFEAQLAAEVARRVPA